MDITERSSRRAASGLMVWEYRVALDAGDPWLITVAGHEQDGYAWSIHDDILVDESEARFFRTREEALAAAVDWLRRVIGLPPEDLLVPEA